MLWWDCFSSQEVGDLSLFNEEVRETEDLNNELKAGKLTQANSCIKLSN